jgi:hypothetical protein
MASYERTIDRPAAAAAADRPLVGAVAQLTGAPLDFIKTAAAFFMVLDHYNTIILNRAEVWLFRFGRIAFPLFCFAVACHVIRDRDHRGRSLAILLVFAVVTQPIYAWAFQTTGGNVLFTLAAGIAIATFLANLHPLLRHALLALAFVVSWWIPNYAITVSDYGLIGMVFPAAIVLTAIGGWSYLPWAILYGASVNVFPQVGPDDVFDMLTGHPDLGRWFEPAIDAVFAVGGGAVVVAASTAFIGQARFLPRYALHVFYPGHIGLLALLRTLLPLLPH